MQNNCPVCTAPIPADRLMCRRHWNLVPAELQRRVWATYRVVNGSVRQMGNLTARANSVAQYARARTAAIDAVRQALAGAPPSNGD